MSYRSQAVASTFLGTPLTVAICALYVSYGFGAPATNFVVAMFLLVPLWTVIMVWGLKRENPRVVWAVLAGLLLLVTTIILLIRQNTGA